MMPFSHAMTTTTTTTKMSPRSVSSSSSSFSVAVKYSSRRAQSPRVPGKKRLRHAPKASTDGGDGYDCCASMDWGEPATCANGYTPMSEDDCLYTCCPASVIVSGSVTLYEDKSRGSECDALDSSGNVVDADSADHCCQDEDYCCNFGSCTSDSDYCGYRFHC